MILQRLRVKNFRNHADTLVELGDGINGLLGSNGQGKTNLLEAISFLSLTKSFYAAGDGRVVQIGKPFFEVHGTVVGNGGVAHEVRVVYDAVTGEKAIAVNGARADTFASVVGQFPVVILSPEAHGITAGGPAERRKFMDLALSQVSRAYLEDVVEYRRALRQRNRLLAEARVRGGVSPSVLEPWTLSLATRGGRLMERRRAFVDEFRGYVRDAYASLVPENETPGMAYATFREVDGSAGAADLAGLMLEELHARGGEETARGITLVGPHRDDLTLTLNGISVQHYASQGQHKTFLVAMKVAEFFYVRDRKNEAPVFLLDDLFSEFDEHRARRILGLVAGLGQTVITATDEGVFRHAVDWDGRHRRFMVTNGTCTPATD